MDKLQAPLRLIDQFSQLDEILRMVIEQYDFDLRVAAPGIIQSFDVDEQTVTVQLCIKDIIYVDKQQTIPIPVLQDVPLVIPKAGNFVITVPPKVGDECLVVFADTCIDSWWKLGEETQNVNNNGAQEPLSIRRHDLSDGFAILGCWSQKKLIENYATDSLEIRTLDGVTKVQVSDDEINIVENETVVTIQDGVVTIKSDSIKLGDTSGLRKLIDERIITLLNLHTHPYDDAGSPSTTEPPSVPIVLEDCATTITEAI